MAQLLTSLCPPSTTSTPYNFSCSYLFPTLSLSLNKPTILSLRHSLRAHSKIRCTSSSTILTVENPSSGTQQVDGPDGDGNENSPTRLLAQNVPWTATHEEIRALFQQHGTVVDVELSMHSKNKNRGLAFVEMGSAEEAAQAFAKLEASEYEGRTLKLTYARPKKKKASTPVKTKPAVVYNLFVANLSYEARAKDLKEFFQSGGSDVVSAEIIFQDTPRRSAGYGFVSFKTKKEADEALSAFEGKEMMGRPIRVAPSKRFVKLESEINPKTEDGEDVSTELIQGSKQPDTSDNL